MTLNLCVTRPYNLGERDLTWYPQGCVSLQCSSGGVKRQILSVFLYGAVVNGFTPGVHTHVVSEVYTYVIT